MGGSEHWTLPALGRTHTIEVDRTKWVIRPDFDAVLRVSQVSAEAKVEPGVEMTDGQMALVKRACVDELLDAEQAKVFWSWSPERQAMMAEKLFLIWNEIRSGNQYGNPGDTPVEPVADAAESGPDPTASPSA